MEIEKQEEKSTTRKVEMNNPQKVEKSQESHILLNEEEMMPDGV